MKINSHHYRTIWLAEDGETVNIIDQTKLPHEFEVVQLRTLNDAARAILTMQVRGAPLIGATAAYGVCLALLKDTSDEALDNAIETLAKQRPTAINLRWALNEMRNAVRNVPHAERRITAYKRANEICNEDVAGCQKIGQHGLKSSKKLLPAKAHTIRSTSSPIAMPAGLPASIGEPPQRRFTPPTIKVFPFTFMSMKHVRAIKAHR